MTALMPYISCFSNILLACELLFCVPMLKLRVSWPAAIAMVLTFAVLFNSRVINNATGADTPLGTDWVISLTTTLIFLASVVLIRLVFSCSWRLALFFGVAGYATENLIFYVRRIGTYFPWLALGEPWYSLVRVTLAILLCLALYRTLVRRYPRGKEPQVSNPFMLSFVVLTLIVTNVLSTWVRVDGTQTPQVALYAIICNVMLLMIEFDVFQRSSMEQERQILEQIMVERERQQRMSQENVDIINVKCHDLKHQIAALRDMPSGSERDQTISELERAVFVYDSEVRTGNHALDTVLTEKSLVCEAHGIEFTCIADGSCLEHMGAVDLYTLFGNALDNAIEATQQVPDPDARLVDLRVERRGLLALIRIENTCVGRVELVDGLPSTTKDDPDYHGFGLKSIRMVVERLGGNMTIEPREGHFTLCILLPANCER